MKSKYFHISFSILLFYGIYLIAPTSFINQGNKNILESFLIGRKIIPTTENQNIEIEQNANEAQLPVDEDGCISPLYSFAYSSQRESEKPTPGVNIHIFPESPWRYETSLLDINDKKSWGNNLEVVRTVNGRKEIWVSVIRRGVDIWDSASRIFQFEVYRPQQKTWEIIDSKNIGSDISVVRLFINSDGSLWGINDKNNTGIEKSENIPLISKFNEVTKRFEFVDETSIIPFGETILDNDGVFWIISNGDAIYSYNTISRKIIKHAQIPESYIITDITMDANRNIYFAAYQIPSNLITDRYLYRYSIEKNELSEIYLDLPPWPAFSSLLVDHIGRLWLGGVAWREPNGDLYQIHPSPIFISNVDQGAYFYRWESPAIITETSDGHLWFETDNGLAWADPKEKRWCWLSTETSSIVEDSEGYIWILANDKLYVDNVRQ